MYCRRLAPTSADALDFRCRSLRSARLGINRGAQIKVYNSGGCDIVRQLSETTARGYQPGEYFRYLYMGQSTQSLSIGGYGKLVEIDVNVVQACSVSGTTMYLINFGAPAYPGFINPYEYQITFDVTVVGQRTFTLNELIGKQTNDSVLLNGVAQNSLPAVWNGNVFGGQFSINPANYQPYQLPIVEMIFKYYIGNANKIVPVNIGLNSYVIAAVTGMLP